MKTSETTQELFKAIGSVQHEIPYLGKDSKNYQNRYTSLPAFNEKTRSALNREGLAFAHAPDHIDGAPALTTRLTHHPSGEFMEATFPLPAGILNKGNAAQDGGAGMTYVTRYAKHAFLSIASDDDDAISLNAPPQKAEAPVVEGASDWEKGIEHFPVKIKPDHQPPTKELLIKHLRGAKTLNTLERIDTKAQSYPKLYDADVRTAYCDMRDALMDKERG